MSFRKIDELLRNRQYEEAIDDCTALLSSGIGDRAGLLRLRSKAYALMGNYRSAFNDRRLVLEMGVDDIRDYFLAANDALFAGDLRTAKQWFEEVLRLGAETNEAWFESGTNFLLAYIHKELGNYEQALKHLDAAVAIESDVGMPVPGICGIYDQKQLKEDIRQRIAK